MHSDGVIQPWPMCVYVEQLHETYGTIRNAYDSSENSRVLMLLELSATG